MSLQNVVAGPDVIAGIGVIQQPPAVEKGKHQEKREKDYLGNCRNKEGCQFPGSHSKPCVCHGATVFFLASLSAASTAWA